ncbi:MAG: ABC transporter permease [Coriobacteriales bacterium]|jgi:NitT/TauT family transport system permease protein|nr:ABC transporter permease [Coriobacteriales bacterium]
MSSRAIAETHFADLSDDLPPVPVLTNTSVTQTPPVPLSTGDLSAAKTQPAHKQSVLASTADPVYWKPQSRLWYAVSIGGFLVALALSYLVPDNIPGLERGVDFSTDYPLDPTNYRIFLVVVAVILALLYPISRFFPSLRRRLLHKAQFVCAGALALAVWDVLTSKLFILQPPYFPGPVTILAYLPTNWLNLLGHIGASSRLFAIGLIIGTLAGIGTGILIGWYRQWFYWLFPVLKFTGVVPATAWMPIATVLLKPAPVAMTFLLVIASWFIISFMMCQGIESTPKALYEVSETLGARRSFLLFHVAIPHAMPSIFTGISMATSMSFLTLVAAEMMGATAGLGYFINYSKTFSKFYQVYAAIIIMFIVFSIILAIIDTVRGRVLRWQKGLVQQ